jgi:hypothetical protein
VSGSPNPILPYQEISRRALPHLFLFDSPLTHLGLMSVSHTACLPASHHLVYFGPVLIPKLG